MTTRIGLLWPQTAGIWTAGNLYFENLLTSVFHADRFAEVTVLEPTNGAYATGSHLAPTAQIVNVATPPFATSSAAKFAGLVRRHFGVPEPSILTAARSAGVEVVFGDIDPRSRFPMPWVGWIPDFQHLHFPQFFSDEELAFRDTIYARLAERASLVLLSSQDASNDFAAFAPAHADKARVAPFVSLFGDESFQVDPTRAAKKFTVRSPFVVVPNQWWQHKNHEVTIRAAALMKESGHELTWVMTGALADYRNQMHVSSLLQLISELGVRDCVVILGALPRSEQVQLMRAADCIVQPSLFEGWSTVVEDAKTLGQRIVLSDIPVHREQDPAGGLYFDPASPEDLASKLAEMADGARERQDELWARAEAVARARKFGERFVSICDEAAARS